jgi:hypothetical protein
VKIELKSIELRNFKGIIKEKIKFSKDTKIYLENEGGKTTIFDSFMWLLFGKDSLGQADFEIKTICTERNQKHFPDYEVGAEIHNLEHSVEAVLLVDGAESRFKKVFKEKWTKRRGAAKKEFTGHETDHFIDEVPLPKKNYTKMISELIDENVFRMLTDVREFNSIHWEKRREILLKLAGDFDESEIDGFKSVKHILGNRKIEELKKIVAGKQKAINKELTSIPIKIEENNRFIIEGVGGDVELVNSRISASESQKGHIENEIAVLKSDPGMIEKRKKIAKIENEILEKKNDFQKVRLEEREALHLKFSDLREEESIYKLEIKNFLDNESHISTELKANEKRLEHVRELWRKVANQNVDIEKTCPTCSQDLPGWRVQEAEENLKLKKAEELEEFAEKGRKIKEEIERLKGDIPEDDSMKKKSESNLAEVSKLIAGFVKELAENAARDVDVKELEYAKATLWETLDNDQGADTSKFDEELKTVVESIQADKKIILDIEKNEEYRERISQLENDEKNLSLEYAKNEKDLDLIDKFVVSKVVFIEDIINERFKIARFGMFHQQINEGVKETCETLKDGVPYRSINNAGRIQVGVDIIDTLQDFYEFAAPIWIDNRESVSDLPAVDTQIISLYVSENDKKMRVENGN